MLHEQATESDDEYFLKYTKKVTLVIGLPDIIDFTTEATVSVSAPTKQNCVVKTHVITNEY